MSSKILSLSTFLLFSCAHGLSTQSIEIFSTSFEISPIKTLKAELGIPIIVGEGETVFFNSFSYLQFFDKTIHYGFTKENTNDIEESIYSIKYDLTYLQRLNSSHQLVLGAGTEIASAHETRVSGSSVSINTLAGIAFFTDNKNYYGFGLTYRIGILFPIPYLNFKVDLTDYIRVYGIVPEFLTISYLPDRKIELGLKAEMISLKYEGNPEKYTVENPFVSLTNIWIGASITINLFEYLFFGIEGGYSIYRSASLIQTGNWESTNLENTPIVRCSFTIGLN